MASTFNGINIALRGLLAEQRSLDVTGHNIANANRTGYTRQEVVRTAAPALQLPQGALQGGMGAQLGQGVEIQEYRRIRDDFLDLQYRAQNMSLGQEATTAQRLGQIEDVLGEPGPDGIGAKLDKFWSSWQTLAGHPENGSARIAVVGAATELADAFRALDANLTAIADNVDAEYAALTGGSGPVAQAATELGRLNTAIRQAVEAGQQPNDLLDRRDLLLDQLSEYGQVSVTDLGSGTIRVNFGDAGAPLVDDTTVTWPQALTSPGGKLGALLTVSGTTIPSYRAALDAVANQITTAVNGLHPTPVFGGATAGTITVTATASTIQAGATSAPGDNSVATEIGRLRGAAIDRGYADVVAQVGSDVGRAERGLATATSVAAAVSERRASVSSVSMDEELTAMIRFQRGYQAASRVMNTMDDALDTLINRTGRVGL